MSGNIQNVNINSVNTTEVSEEKVLAEKPTSEYSYTSVETIGVNTSKGWYSSNNSSILLSGDRSFEIYFKTPKDLKNRQKIFNDRINSGAGIQLEVNVQGNLQIYVGAAVVPAFILDPETCYHVVVYFSSATNKGGVYINSNLHSTVDFTDPYPSNYFILGYNSTQLTESNLSFTGIIYYCRLYNTVLSEEDAITLWNNGCPQLYKISDSNSLINSCVAEFLGKNARSTGWIASIGSANLSIINTPEVLTGTYLPKGVDTSKGFYFSTNPFLTFVGDRTIEIYFRIPESVTSFQNIYNSVSNSVNGILIRLSNVTQAISVVVGGTTSRAYPFTVNTDYHVVVSISGLTFKMYVNGILHDTKTVNSITTPDSYIIGSYNHASAGSGLYRGTIYYSRLYNAPLTNEEVSLLWNNGNPLGYNLSDVRCVANYNQFNVTSEAWYDPSGGVNLVSLGTPQPNIQTFLAKEFNWPDLSENRYKVFAEDFTENQTIYFDSEENFIDADSRSDTRRVIWNINDDELFHKYAYGIEKDITNSSTSCTRVGNMSLHASLPVQSGMRRCLLLDDGTVNYYLSATDSTKKEDGTDAVLDGSDGMVMVEIPAHWRRFEQDGNIMRAWVSEVALPGFHFVPKCYRSAYEASLDRSASDVPKLASVVNTTASFRGGNNNSDWDGTYRTLLGRPATAVSLTNFRTYARNRGNAGKNGAGWNCDVYEVQKTCWWLYAIEYANFNCQLAYNAAPTSEGYKQGGLSSGVTTLNSTKWSAYNSYCPFIPCGITNTLGNKTGVVEFTMPDEYDPGVPTKVNVPSYRGLENPFGHVCSWTDGCKCNIQSADAGGVSEFFVCTDPAKFQDSDYTDYEKRGELSRNIGYIKIMMIGEYGENMPTAVGASSTTYFADYFYTNVVGSTGQRGVLFGGIAVYGVDAGLLFTITNYLASVTNTAFGSRLCFLPSVEASEEYPTSKGVGVINITQEKKGIGTMGIGADFTVATHIGAQFNGGYFSVANPILSTFSGAKSVVVTFRTLEDISTRQTIYQLYGSLTIYIQNGTIYIQKGVTNQISTSIAANTLYQIVVTLNSYTEEILVWLNGSTVNTVTTTYSESPGAFIYIGSELNGVSAIYPFSGIIYNAYLMDIHAGSIIGNLWNGGKPLHVNIYNYVTNRLITDLTENSKTIPLDDPAWRINANSGLSITQTSEKITVTCDGTGSVTGALYFASMSIPEDGCYYIVVTGKVITGEVSIRTTLSNGALWEKPLLIAHNITSNQEFIASADCFNNLGKGSGPYISFGTKDPFTVEITTVGYSKVGIVANHSQGNLHYSPEPYYEKQWRDTSGNGLTLEAQGNIDIL